MNFFIETLNQWGANFQDFAWPMLWQSSLLIAALLAFDFLFRRRLRATIRYALWLVVLIKLCLSPTLSLPTSPAWWLHQPPPPVAAKPKLPHYTVTYDQGPLPEIPSTPLPIFESPKPTLTSVAWLLVIASSGSGILLIWMLVRWWQITRLVRRAAISERLTALAEGARCAIGMKKNVPVKLTSNTMSPAVCGLFRPVILIPQSLATEFSNEQLHAVLLHELIHLRRSDVWLNFLQALLQVAYWWHPLVWVANARIRRVREEAVDDTVMLALHDEAETYAPTLLEVAKLALNRPLATLGLVGILESRSALRQRIERLVDFQPPRKAGLTLVSVLGILTFTAVAVPMGEGPSPAEKSTATDTAMVEEQSLTVKVNPEIFFRNLKAQAAKTMLSPTNYWGDILMGLLQDAGVDCNPPHGLAFTNATGDITTRNTPEQLEVFRRVIDQLNRVDGICELPLDNNPLRKNVLIEGRFYPMSAGEFDQFASGLHHYSGGLPSEEWWSVPPESFKQSIHGIEASGIKLIQRPRIQTGSGMPATLYVGNGTNSLELSCKPMAKEGFIDLAIECTVITGAPANAVTNHVFSKAATEERGGIVLRMENYGGHAGSNLVVLISAETLTNTARFQERLVAIIHRAGSTNLTATNATVGTVTGLLTDPNFRNVVYALEQRSGAEHLAEPEVTTTSGRGINRISIPTISMPVSKLNTNQLKQNGRQQIVQKLSAIRLEKMAFDAVPLGDVLRWLSGEARLRDPERKGINFMITPSPSDGTNEVALLPITINPALTNLTLDDALDAVLLVAPKPIKYSVQDFAVVFSARQTTTELFSRTFKINPEVFFKNQSGNATNKLETGVQFAKRVFGLAGVDWESPQGKAIFYNDRLGKLFVKATESDLDKIERAIEAFNGGLSGTTSADTAGTMTRTFRLVQRIQAEELKKHLLEAGVKIPPTVFFYNDVSGTFGVRGSKEQLALVHQVVLKLNGYSTNEIEADNQNFLRSAGTLPSTGETTKNLFSRTFRLNERVSTEVLQKNTGLQTTDVSLLARTFFSNLGVDFEHPPGKSVFYNERMSKLFVRATVADLDLIEQAVEVLVATPPQIHIKVRFVEVPRSGKDMYLGMIATNGLNTSSNPSEVTFLTISPGNSNPSTVSTGKPEVTGLTGILTEENFKKTMHALDARKDVEFLAEPEVITIGGRQIQMRATERISVVTDLAFQEGWTNGNGVVISNSIVPQTQQIETGPILDVVPDVLADGYTISLKVAPSVTEFLGYAKTNADMVITNLAGEKIKVAKPLPQFRVRQTTASVNIRDNQTLVLSGFPEKHITAGKEVESKSNRSDKNLLVFITATIVDPAGNRVHPDDANGGIPPQPQQPR